MTEHAELSASGAKRWMNCPGSVRLLRAVEVRGSGPAAREGSAAHGLASAALEHYIAYCTKPYNDWTVALDRSWTAMPWFGKVILLDADDWVQSIAPREDKVPLPPSWAKFVVTLEMVEAVDEYLEEVRSVVERFGRGTEVLVERRLDLSQALADSQAGARRKDCGPQTPRPVQYLRRLHRAAVRRRRRGRFQVRPRRRSRDRRAWRSQLSAHVLRARRGPRAGKPRRPVDRDRGRSASVSARRRARATVDGHASRAARLAGQVVRGGSSHSRS